MTNMKKIIYRAQDRGYFNHGWLETYHSFSFAGWFDRNKMNFGTLRVINDDKIAPNAGFGLHPHDNMEIITIILEGELKHTDSMGNEGVIKKQEIQVMSAGTGIMHSEENPSIDMSCELFQIWIFPEFRDIEPRYDQISFKDLIIKNQIIKLVGPKNSEYPLFINQNAFISYIELDKDTTIPYKTNIANNGIYILVIEGQVNIADENIEKKDALGIWDIEKIDIVSQENSKLLIFEIPMER